MSTTRIIAGTLIGSCNYQESKASLTRFFNSGQVMDTTSAAGGSQIKTINGLAIASVKTVNGLAIASMKTRNGLTNV